MGKAKKSTKKFLQKKGTGQQVFKKKPVAHRSRDRAAPADNNETAEETLQNVAELGMDDFLSGDFLNLNGGNAAGGGSSSDEEEGSDFDSEEKADLEDLSDSDEEELAAVPKSVGKAATAKEKEEEEEEESDDEEEGDGDGIGAQNARFKDEIAAHKAQLEKLKEADPEFYEYLAATDKELLDFGAGDESEEEESEEEEEEEEEEFEEAEKPAAAQVAEKAKADVPSVEKGTITLAMVDTWCAAAKQHAALGAMRNILRAYRSACHYGDSEEEVEATLRLGSSAVYNKLMLFVLREADGIFKRMLGIENEENFEALALGKLPRWKKVEPLVKSYIGNTLHLLGQMTEPSMLAFILRRIRASTIFFAPYSKLQRRLLKAALTLFGSADAAPRVQAILLVRSMAMKLPQPSLDACLKGVYRAYSSNAKFVNAASVPHINFMAACVVELYGLDPVASYQHAFGFIRQLALLLRQALTSKSKEAYREVYCWQTLNCLELWAKVLAAHSDSTELKPLVYPAVQLLLGAARLVPTPSYFPLRLRCARALNRLAQATGVFVPVAPLVLEILQWGDLSRAPKPAPGDKPTEVLLQLRAGKSVARSAPYQEEIVEQALELLADHLSQWACHVSFPELAHLPLAQLRRYAKTTPVERFRKSARQLADAIERNISFVGKARDHVEFSPKDLSEVANFLGKESTKGTAPVVQHAATLRDRARQRLAARSALEVEIGGELPGSAKAGLAEADGAAGEWDKAPKGDILPGKKKKSEKKT
ncbi:hypothetical protein Ndes2437A_g07590 [Nannochloris sp. 'desiccata']